jgi:hypothetical protein
MVTMMQIDTNNDAGKGNSSMKGTTMGDEGKIIIRNSNNDENDDITNITIDPSASSLSSSSPSSFRQSKQQQAVSFSADVNASKMQASFAERTAAEMEEIMNWYSKYDGDEKSSTKTVDQSQSMPNNAMVYDDIVLPEEEVEEGFDYKEVNDNDDNICHLEQEQLECEVDDCNSVLVVDYFSPANRNKTTTTTTTPSSSFMKKSSPAEIADTADALIRNTQNMADIVAAFRIAEEDQEQGSESPVRSKIFGGSTGEQARNQTRVADNLIQSPSSPPTTTPTTNDELQDQQQEIILANLMSPLPPVVRNSSSSSTEQVQNQIDAADDLIRNTQNMAEIIAGLQQQSPSSSSNDDGIVDNKSIGTDDDSPASALLETNNRGITNDDDSFDDAAAKLDDDLYSTVKFSSSPQVEGNLGTTSAPPTSYADKYDQYSVVIGGTITTNTISKPTVTGEVKQQQQQQQLAKRSKAKKKKENSLLRGFQMKFFHYYANTIVLWVVVPLLLSILIGWIWKSSGTQLLLLQFATTIVQLSLLFITTLLLVSMI